MQVDILEQASVARLNGDNQTAINLCRQMLAQNADNTDAISLLGVSLAEIGELDEARLLIAKALTSAPENWRYLLNQSVLLECEGEIAAARDVAEKAATIAPKCYETWGRLGDLCGKQEDFHRAAEALQKALDLFPDHPALALRLAGAAYETADYDRANRALDIFEKIAPGHPQALRLRTFIARQNHDWEILIDSAKASLAASPDDEAPRVALAYAYAQQGYYAKAVETYRPLADKAQPQASHLATLGKYLIGARDLSAGADYHRRALEIDPHNSIAATGLSRYLNFIGDFTQAAQYARQAIASNPNDAEAFSELSLATGSKLTTEEIEQLRKIGADETQGIKHRVIAWFSRGDALHQRKMHESAFEAWATANELKHAIGDKDKSVRYNAAGQEALFARLIRVFSDDVKTSEADSNRRPAPIFIVGMPRSGTTLLDSALSAHPDVSSGGELPYMTFALTQFFEWADKAGWSGGMIPDDILAAFRDEYFEQYRKYNVTDAPFITDKLPNNFLSVGLIRRVFPEARIIQIRRNPIETGFSIYRRNFTSSWQFANSLEEIGHFYSLYARLTQHWSRTIGDDIAFVQYEDLIHDFEGELRRIISFCGLDWNPACLEYYKQERTVITFSAAQVRKPPSAEHLNSTAPYLAHLESLRTALLAGNINLKTGALNPAAQN